jgi:hypothetical protein
MAVVNSGTGEPGSTALRFDAKRIGVAINRPSNAM